MSLKLRKPATARLQPTFIDLVKVRIAKVVDINIPSHNHTLPARLYHPKPDKAIPVILFFHGGGFSLSGVTSYDHFCRRLSKTTDCAVLSIDYRLAPEYKFPAAHDDALDSLNWLVSKGHELNVDTETLYVAGDSAGGNLAAYLSVAALGADIQLKGQILIYPVLDGGKRKRVYYDQFLLRKADSEWFIKNLIKGPEDLSSKRFSVINNDLMGVCKTIVIKAQFDHLNSEIDDYCEKLKQDQIDVRVIEVPETFHGFITMFNWTNRAAQCLKEIREFCK